MAKKEQNKEKGSVVRDSEPLVEKQETVKPWPQPNRKKKKNSD